MRAPRVHADLRAQEERHGRKRIAHLVHDAGLVVACHWHGGPITTRRNKKARPAPDPLPRNFTASGPNQLWITGFTYLPTAAGFLCLAVVLDVWSRKLGAEHRSEVVGWSVLKISGQPNRAKASSSASTQNSTSIVFDTRQDSIFLVDQSITATK